MSSSSSISDTLCLNCHPLLMIHSLSPPLLLHTFQTLSMIQTTLTITHSSQFLGEMDLCCLNFLLRVLRVLYHLYCSRLLPLCPLQLPLLLPQLLSLNWLPLAHNIKGSLEMNGYQNNGQFPCATGRSESPLQSFPLLSLMNPPMIHLSSVCLYTQAHILQTVITVSRQGFMAQGL